MREDKERLAAWMQFEQSGTVADYLNYCAQIDREGTETDAAENERTGHTGEGPEQR